MFFKKFSKREIKGYPNFKNPNENNFVLKIFNIKKYHQCLSNIEIFVPFGTFSQNKKIPGLGIFIFKVLGVILKKSKKIIFLKFFMVISSSFLGCGGHRLTVSSQKKVSRPSPPASAS